MVNCTYIYIFSLLFGIIIIIIISFCRGRSDGVDVVLKQSIRTKLFLFLCSLLRSVIIIIIIMLWSTVELSYSLHWYNIITYGKDTVLFDLVAVVIDFVTYLAPRLLRNASIFNVVAREPKKVNTRRRFVWAQSSCWKNDKKKLFVPIAFQLFVYVCRSGILFTMKQFNN